MLKCRKGVTLLEIILAIAISGLVISLACAFLFTNQNAYFAVMSRLDAQSSARAAMENVMTNIRRSNQRELYSVPDGNGLTLTIPDSEGQLLNYTYTVEFNAETNLHEFVLTVDDSRFVVATGIDGIEGFAVEKTDNDLITVRIRTHATRYDKQAVCEVSNYHRIKVDN
ncbi:MAG: hypothetical protein BWY15_00256 [Firmicutes bacterium ADurb.Bin193]|nr:MAG: hypothetical protein BWY15_00256 [Firmicutes bacterium ADurb.Bin193]